MKRLAFSALVIGLAACGSDSDHRPDGSGQVSVEDLVVGTGATAAAGDTLTVNYTGWLADGTQFDTSYGKQPFAFPLGPGGSSRAGTWASPA